VKGEKEILAARTANTKTFDLGGSRRRLEWYGRPIHAPADCQRWARGEPCDWDDIDTGVVQKAGRLAVNKAWYGCELLPDAVGYLYTSIKTGGTVEVRLLELDGKPVTAPAPQAEPGKVWWRSVATDLDIYLEIRPGNIELFKRLLSDKAPRSLLWQVTERDDRSIPLKHQTAGHDNCDLTDPARDGTGVGRVRRRIEMATAVVGPESRGQGTITYTVLERWTGKTVALDADRVPSLSAEVSYPVLIDVTVNETITADADDGFQKNDLVWNTSYGGTGDSIIYDPANAEHMFPGWRFQTVAVPQGATINSATLTLNITKIGGGTGSAATVFGSAVDDAPAWANNAGPREMTKTTASASFGAWGGSASLGSKTITVTSIVQELVNRAGWVSNNDMAFAAFFTEADNVAYSYFDDLAGGSSNVAALSIDYTAAGGGPITKVMSDALTLSDARVSGATRPRVQTDSIVVTDGGVQWRRLKRVMDEPTVVIDSIVKNLVLGGSTLYTKVMSDSLAATDSLVQWLRRVRNAIDTTILSDGDTYRTSIVTADEGVDLTDSAIDILRLKRIAEDSLNIIDGFSKALAGAGIVYAKVMSDTVTLIDDAGQRWRLRFAQLTDAVGLSDQVLDYLRAVRSLGDVVELSDGTVKVRRTIKSMDESIEVTDNKISTLYLDQISNTSFTFGSSGPPFRFGGM
jgi:hypothetical protein